MKKETIKQKSKRELQKFILQTEKCIAQKQEELDLAKEVLKVKGEESIVDGAYYAEVKDGSEALLVQVTDSKVHSYCELAGHKLWFEKGRLVEFIKRKPKVRKVRDRFEMALNGKKWELELLVSYADIDLRYSSSDLAVTYLQIPILSERDRLFTLRRWIRLLQDYPALKDAINRLIVVMNERYNMRIEMISDLDSEILEMTEVAKFREFVELNRNDVEMKVYVKVIYEIMRWFTWVNECNRWKMRGRRVEWVVGEIDKVVSEMEEEITEASLIEL